ncbi:hypothetical protein Efla_002722 [Eimeria flavescens]
MASEPFIDYKPTWEAVAGGTGTPSDSAADTDALAAKVCKRKDDDDKYRTHDALKNRSVVVVNISSALDGCDDQLLPATFRALESDLGFHPSLLGYITLSQTLCLSLFCPFWGYLADRHSRKWLLVFGTAAWGCVTTALGLVSEFWQVALLRALNGIFLGSVGPVSQSILADTSSRKSLGLSFGLVQLCTSMGRLVGGVVTTTVAQIQMGALKGWRACFVCVGAMSMLLGVIIAFVLEEIPRRRVLRPVVDDSGGTGSNPQVTDSWWKFLKDVFTQSLATPSVVIVLIEASWSGLVGTIPWSAFSFNTMFFQYCSMSDLKAAYIMGALLMGSAVGGVLGGLLGDRLFQWSPAHGRPLVGQFAMAIRVPLLIIAYVVVPKDESSFGVFMLIALLVGLSSMAGVAVNRPILADVVRPNHKATVFALTVAVEGSGAAILGAPLVGYLAEHSFGYLRTTLLVSEMPEGLRLGNANALASALVFLTAIPWSLSFLLYGILHFTYGKDQSIINTIVADEYKFNERMDEDMETSVTAAAQALSDEAEGANVLLQGSDPDSLSSD